MDKIILEGLSYYAHHGVHDFEKLYGNHYNVDVIIEADLKKAGETDDLKDTIDYRRVYTAVTVAFKQRADLLEHVAARIIKDLMDTWPQIDAVEVKVAKLNPPIDGDVRASAIEMRRTR